MDTKTILNDASARMQKAIDHLEEELLNVRAGKASPNVLNGVMVDYFGSQMPVSGTASVTVPDAKTILIQPWDKNMLRPIEKAIIDSNIGLTPSNNGETIRLTIPPLTEERRKELVKQVRAEAETARISLRNARREAVDAFKKAQKEGMPEDESKDGETQSQKLLEKFSKALDEVLAKKEHLNKDVALQRIKLDRERKAFEAQKDQQKKEAQAKSQEEAKRQEQFLRFARTYPKVKPNDIPKDVWDAFKDGEDLVNAYARVENRELREKVSKLESQLETAKKNSENKRRSAGSQRSAGSASEMDEFDRAWYDGT